MILDYSKGLQDSIRYSVGAFVFGETNLSADLVYWNVTSGTAVDTSATKGDVIAVYAASQLSVNYWSVNYGNGVTIASGAPALLPTDDTVIRSSYSATGYYYPSVYLEDKYLQQRIYNKQILILDAAGEVIPETIYYLSGNVYVDFENYTSGNGTSSQPLTYDQMASTLNDNPVGNLRYTDGTTFLCKGTKYIRDWVNLTQAPTPLQPENDNGTPKNVTIDTWDAEVYGPWRIVNFYRLGTLQSGTLCTGLITFKNGILQEKDQLVVSFRGNIQFENCFIKIDKSPLLLRPFTENAILLKGCTIAMNNIYSGVIDETSEGTPSANYILCYSESVSLPSQAIFTDCVIDSYIRQQSPYTNFDISINHCTTTKINLDGFIDATFVNPTLNGVQYAWQKYWDDPSSTWSKKSWPDYNGDKSDFYYTMLGNGITMTKTLSIPFLWGTTRNGIGAFVYSLNADEPTTGKIRIVASDGQYVEIDPPEYGYTSEYVMAQDINKSIDGYYYERSLDKEFDYITSENNTWKFNQTTKVALNTLFRDVIRNDVFTLKLGTHCGWYPFGVQFGDSGEFYVKLLDRKQSGVLENPLSYYEDKLDFVCRRTSIISDISVPTICYSEGSNNIFDVPGVRYIKFVPEPVYMEKGNALSIAGKFTMFDTITDYYKTNLTIIGSNKIAHNIMNQITNIIRTSQFTMTTPNNSNPFGLDITKDINTYEVMNINNKVKITHTGHNEWSIGPITLALIKEKTY
jgi:hypothetical protein